MKASIIIPIFNEVNYIDNCLLSIIENTSCFKEIEVLLIDGGSDDGTLDKINEYVDKYNNIFLYANLKKITPAALNIGVKKSKGKYIIRLDAHAEYAHNYVDNCLFEIENSDSSIVNVGGVISTKPSNDSKIAKSIAVVLSMPIGVGGSHFRVNKPENKKQFVETVPFGCFRKSIFDEIGLFNENEPRNEDLEFNKRILKAGKKILCNQEIVSIYFSRSTFSSFILQAFDNGFIVTNRFRGSSSFHNIRHFTPLFFAIFFIMSFFLILFTSIGSQVIILWMTYIAVLIAFSFREALVNKFYSFLVFIPFLLFSLHLSYGLGSIVGLFSSFRKSKEF